MPVITPAFPAMCATHTITTSTKQIMMEEFTRADSIVRDVYEGKASWKALFNRHSFFTKDHKYYLSVIAASRTKEADLTFHGLVQSKVRILVTGIDDGQTGIDIARPYIDGFDRVHRCKNEDQVDAVTKGSLEYMIPASDVPEPGTSADHIIYTCTFYIGLRLPLGMYFAIHSPSWTDTMQSAAHSTYLTPQISSVQRLPNPTCTTKRRCPSK
jgi:poly(A) polymerase